MKIAKLLVLGAVLLISGKALAVDGNVWPKPEAPGVTQFVKYAENDTMYMYNVAAKMFFVGGNDYNTRASVGIKGYKVIFVQTDDGLELRDSVETQSAVKCTFSTEDAAAIWVDNSNETWRFWTVTENGDSYRIRRTWCRLMVLADWCLWYLYEICGGTSCYQIQEKETRWQDYRRSDVRFGIWVRMEMACRAVCHIHCYRLFWYW